MDKKNLDVINVGIHIGHDRSVSVVRDGELIGHLAEERLDRIKHSPSVDFPKKSLLALVEYLGFTLNDVENFVITYAFTEIDRIIENLAEEFRQEFKLEGKNVIGLSHHLAHAYSSYYTSPFDDALILVCDGAGDLTAQGRLEAESAFEVNDGQLECFWRRTQDIPSSYSDRRNFFHPDYISNQDQDKQISLARKYEQLTYLIGFNWGQSGKTMGLASYGKSLASLETRFSKKNSLEFDIRVKDLIFQLDELREKEGLYHHEFIKLYRQDIAATAQSEIEKVVIELLNQLFVKTDSTNLCLAGGLFLNCVINHKILEKTSFENVHICPAAGDDGQSIGAAFYGHYISGTKNKKPYVFTPYLGISYEQSQIGRLLSASNYNYSVFETSELVGLLCGGKIGGILRGRSELGPRALGHRSIISSPFSINTKNLLNQYIKCREPFRPFAPMVTKESQYDFFELRQSSPFMLFSTQVKPKFREALGAITHVDGSARVQAVDREHEPFLHNLLCEIEKTTGYPILLNTSFNGPEEPIVESPEDAISVFERSNLDFLILENFLIQKPSWPTAEPKSIE